MEYLLYLSVGAVAGLIAGLFGVGGGIVIVSILIFTFTAHGFSEAVLTQMAIGTSLATIIVTSISAIHTHNARGAVRWDLVRLLVAGIAVGSATGGLLAVSLKGSILQLLFGGFLVAAGLKMLIRSAPQTTHNIPPKGYIAAIGAVIGSVSSLLGIGGGTLTVPALSSFGVRMHQAVGTSAACGLPISVVATITYIVAGWSNDQLPTATVGYIYLPAWFGIILLSVPCSRVGAIWAHKLNEKYLRRGFAGLLIVLGTRLIWINASVGH